MAASDPRVAAEDGAIPEDVERPGTSTVDSDSPKNATLDATTTYQVKLFVPPSDSDTPLSLFSIQKPVGRDETRYLRKTDPHEMLIFTYGLCLNIGKPLTSAGCGVVFSEETPGQENNFSFGLEAKDRPTKDRADLRAIIAALQHRDWYDEGARRVVIATCSKRVTDNATKGVYYWVRNNWKDYSNVAITNQDFWKLLVAEVSRYRNKGIENSNEAVEVLFWRIDRKLNKAADLAMDAAGEVVVGLIDKK